MTEFTVIDREGRDHKISGLASESVMEAMRSAGLPVQAVCGGHGICATCHVFVDAPYHGAFDGPDEDEIDLLRDAEAYDPVRSRLSCQLSVSAVPDGFIAILAPE